MTQSEMADALGVKHRTYGSWERGEAGLSLSMAAECVKLLGCTLEDLAGLQERRQYGSAPDMTIGESIKKLRKAHGLTQEELGRIAGASSMAVSQWENDRAVPRMKTIQNMADYFRVPVSELVDGRIPFEQDMAEIFDDGLAEIERRYLFMETEDREKLLGIIRIISGY